MEDQQKLKSLSAVLKVADGDQKGVVEAYVSVFGVKDSYGDVMVYGCFGKSIAAKPPVICWMHDWREPIGKTLEVREVAAGDASLPDHLKAYGALYVKFQLSLGTSRGSQAYELLKDGVITEFSIGYFERASNEHTADGDRETHVTEVDLVEASPVLRGANPLTSPISVKGPRLPFAAHSEQVLGYLQEFTQRAKDLTAIRAEKAQTPSPARLIEFRAVHTELGDLLKVLEAPSDEEVAKARAAAVLATL